MILFVQTRRQFSILSCGSFMTLDIKKMSITFSLFIAMRWKLWITPFACFMLYGTKNCLPFYLSLSPHLPLPRLLPVVILHFSLCPYKNICVLQFIVCCVRFWKSYIHCLCLSVNCSYLDVEYLLFILNIINGILNAILYFIMLSL